MKPMIGRAWPWSALLLAVAALCWYALEYPLNHDVGWWLHVARSMRDGQAIYADVIEINPPLYGYLVMIPLTVATGLGLPVPLVTQVAVLVLCLSILAGVCWSLRSMMPKGHRAVGMGAAMAIAVIGLPGLDFGQREHLMFALVIPYLLVDAHRSRNPHVTPALSVGVGALAGLGFVLKPHYAVLFVLYELGMAVVRRKWLSRIRRPEFVTVVLLSLLYALGVVLVFPRYVDLLWSSRHLYPAFAAAERSTMIVNTYTVVLAAVAIAGVRQQGGDSNLRAIARCFIVYAGAVWFVAVAQGKGWSYHFYPSLAASTVAGLALTLNGFQRWEKTGGARRRVLAGAGGAALLIVVSMVALVHLRRADWRQERTRMMEAVLSESGAHSFVLLSPTVSDGFPLVNYSSLDWASPFPTLWWLQFAHGDETASRPTAALDAEDPMEHSFRAALVAELLEQEPGVVMVDTAPHPRLGNRVFPYVEYLSRERGFRKLWRDYKRAGTVDRFAVYRRLESEAARAP